MSAPITAGDNHACALNAMGLWCWGSDSHGEIGDGAAVYTTTPAMSF